MAGEDGELLGQRGGPGFQMKALEFDLGGFQSGLQQVQIGIDAGLGALLFDPDQISGESLLLAGCIQFAIDCVELNVGCRGVQSHLFAGLLEAQVGGFTPARAALVY